MIDYKNYEREMTSIEIIRDCCGIAICTFGFLGITIAGFCV